MLTGVRHKMHMWIQHFLFARTVRAKHDGTLNKKVCLREGVPQSGVLSPTLFLVYINDIPTTVTKRVSNTLHADDLAIWNSSEHTTTATYRIQEAINGINKWTHEWGLELNIGEFNCALFSDRKWNSRPACKNRQSGSDTQNPVLYREAETFLHSRINGDWKKKKKKQKKKNPVDTRHTLTQFGDWSWPSRPLSSACPEGTVVWVPIWRGLVFQTLPCVSAVKLTKPQTTSFSLDQNMPTDVSNHGRMALIWRPSCGARQKTSTGRLV